MLKCRQPDVLCGLIVDKFRFENKDKKAKFIKVRCRDVVQILGRFVDK